LRLIINKPIKEDFAAKAKLLAAKIKNQAIDTRNIASGTLRRTNTPKQKNQIKI